MKVLVVFVACLAILGLSEATQQSAARYDDFKVYRVSVKDDQQLSDFKKLSNNLPVRYLNEISGPGRNYDVVVDPDNQGILESTFKYYELDSTLIIEDLQKIIEESISNLDGILNPKLEWTQYHSLKDIYNWLDNLTLKHLNIIKPYIIGWSYEGRPIKAVKISAKRGNKAIFIESNIHAIEWISSATSTYFFDNLLKSKDGPLHDLLTNYDWIFVPIVNPDGFEYSHNVERLWRKNRKPTGFSNSSGICYGTDLNRNFEYEWGGDSYNIHVPCDHWYGGAEAGTEPEVIAIQNFVNSFPKDYIRMYLALHSYGNFVLLPYGHTNKIVPPNYKQMMRIATSFVNAAKVKYGTSFLAGASGRLNYPVSGAAKDWAYGVKGIPFTATIELRDRGTYGFFLPPSQILEVGAEVTDGLIAMVQQAHDEGLFEDDFVIVDENA